MPNLPSPDRPSSYDPRQLSLRQLTWDDENHLAVLTQLNGSVWPRVLPFCLVNVVMTVAVYYLKHYNIVDLSTAPTGHHYMAMVMSFLVVTRVKISYDQYMYQSQFLTSCYEAIRELVQQACVLTAADKNACQYRHDVAAASIHLLAVTMQVLEFRSSLYAPHHSKHEQEVQLPEYLKVVATSNTSSNGSSTPSSGYGTTIDASSRRIQANVRAQCEISGLLAPVSPSRMHKLEQACRVPVILAYQLRTEIMKHRLSPQNNDKQNEWIQDGTFLHPCNEELKLFDLVGSYLQAYSGLVKYMTTPLPFPLVQMTKCFLFIWTLTLPFAICKSIASTSLLALNAVLVALITFGFIGLEFVAMELADCFGDDPSDLDNVGGAEQCYEDCYIAVFKVDGREWALKLRETIENNSIFLPQRWQ